MKLDILSKLNGEVWAITANGHKAFSELASMDFEIRETEYESTKVENGIMYIDVIGTIVPSCPAWLMEYINVASCEVITAQLKSASMRPDVKGVLMTYDTMGGYTVGLPDMADMIAEFDKPMIGYVAGSCASAGYWMACSQEIFASRESINGSIGVYLNMTDSSKYFEMMGLKKILVTTGEFKGQGSDGIPIEASFIEHVKNDIISPVADLFFNHVQTHRALDETLLDGRAFRGIQSQALGLIDSVGTIDDALDKLTLLIQGK